MRIVSKTSDRLILQNSFAETHGVLFASIVLLILGFVILYFPELSHTSEEKKEVSLFLATMGIVILVSWARSGSTTCIFDNNDRCLTINTIHMFVSKKYCNYLFSEINEVILESETDDSISSFKVKLNTKESGEISIGFFSCSKDAAINSARQISNFLNLSGITFVG